MASHLTVSTSNGALGASKSRFSADVSGAVDAFASLLGGRDRQADTRVSSAAEARVELGARDGVALDFGSDDHSKPDDPEAVAAPVDATIPIQDNDVDKEKLTELVDGLADLKARVAAGEKIDAQTLKKLDALLTDVAKSLDVDLSKLTSLGDLAALANGIQPGDTSLEAQLTASLAPLAQGLLDGTAAQADASAELSGQAKALGDKLASLLTALNADGAADQIDLSDADFQAALAKLSSPPVKVETMPALATTELKVPDSSITAKADAQPATDASSDTTTEPKLAVQPTKTAEHSPDKGSDHKPADKKPDDAKISAVATTIDKQPDPQATTQPVQAGRADAVAAPRVVTVGYQTSQQQLNLPQLAFEMARQIGDGNTRFQIRLDPAELGRIDVRLDIDASGQVNAKLTVEKAETLDLMQRDQKGLERALQQAGLDGSKANLEFSLKQNPFSGGQQGQNGNDRNGSAGNNAVADNDDTPVPTVNLYRGSLSASGVNIIA